MGTHPALKLCYRLLFFLALGHAAVTEGEEDVALLPDEICPCIVREECPRVFGTSPEDGLLGSFSPCEDPDSVRCCGVSSRVSVAHSVSSSAGSEKNRENESVRLFPAGIGVPVPLSLPEYVDSRTTTELPRRRIVEVRNYDDVYEDESGSDERITDVDKYVRGDELTAEERERELNSGATLRGENIDDHTGLQTDASLSPDYLDYPGVNKHRIKGGTTQTNTGSRQRGEISSSKRVESTSSSSSSSTSSSSSSSSSDKKDESIVATGDNGSSNFGRTSETRPKLLVKEEDEEEQFETPEIIEQKVTSCDLIDSSISQRGRDEAENNSEFMQGRFGASSQNSIVPVDADLVEVDESDERTTSFDGRPLQNQRDFVGATSPGLGNDRVNQLRPDFRGQTVFRNQESTSQQKNEEVSEESSESEENSSSSFTLTDEQREDVGTSRRPTTRNQGLETGVNSGGQTISGSRSRVSNQRKQESTAKESANLEENSFSSVGGVTSTAEQLQEVGTNTNIAGRWSWLGPTIHAPRSKLERDSAALGLGDRTVSGQQTETSAQQNSQSEKKEFSKSEENTSSNVQSATMNIGGLSDDDSSSKLVDTTLSSGAEIRRPTLNTGRTFYQHRQQAASQKKAQTEKKESSNFEENKSSNAQTSTVNTGEVLADDLSSKVVETSSSSVPEIRRPTSYRVNTFYKQQQEATSQEKAQTEKKESTNLEENTSSDIESKTTNTREPPQHDASLISQPADEQQIEPLMQQKSQSIQKESSSWEKNTSSDVETSSLNTKLPHNDNASSEHLGPISVDRSIYVQREETTSTQTKSEKMSKKSSSDEENTSSNVIKVDTIGEIPSGFKTDGGMDEGNNQQITPHSKGNTIHEQRSGTSTNEESESASSESSSMMENLSTTLNLMNLVTGKTSSVAEGSSKSTEIENRLENAWVWHVANRAYVPVLINAGFLRDRPTATGPVSLNPLSGVTHTDVLDPDLAPELLPLFCGNVVFGERSGGRQTLVCDIPGDNVSPIRFLAGDQKAVNPEKQPNPTLPNTVLPAGGDQRLETDNVERSGSVKIKEDVTNSEMKNTRVENSTMINSMTSESRSEESSKTTTVDAINDSRQEFPRRRVIVRRPVQVPAVEERREEEAVVLSTPTKEVHRGRNHVTDRLESRPAVDSLSNTVVKNQGEIGSRQVARGSVSTSSHSFKKATSSQESMSSNSNQEITTSEFDVPLTDGDNKQRHTEKKNSRFYMAPEKIVEAIDVVPSANSRVSKKRLRNLASAQKVSPENLEVPSMTPFEENDANVEEAESVHPGERDSRRPGFFYRRQSRQANSFAPEVETMTISPDELSVPGRINIVGPIPAGFEDPALGTREEIPMELPKKIGLYALKAAANSRQQVVGRNNTEPFKPSPVDPINH